MGVTAVTVGVWLGVAAGAAYAVYRNPRAARELAGAIFALFTALGVPIAAGLALLAGHAAPKRRHEGHGPPPTAPPRRTAGLTLGQHLHRLYVTEDVITGAQYATLYGAAVDGHVLERLLPASAGVETVLEALNAPQTPQEAFDEAAAIALAGGDALEPLTRRRVLGQAGDVMQLHAGETVEQAERRAGRVITDTQEVRTGASGGYVLARLGGRLCCAGCGAPAGTPCDRSIHR